MANLCDNQIAIYPKNGRKISTKQREKILNYFNSERLHEVLYGISIDYEDEDFIEAQGDSKWNVRAEEWAQFAKEMGVNVRIIGTEFGVGFIQVVKCWVNGTYTEEEIDLAM